MTKQPKCNCEEMTCPDDCNRNHTCKTFWCEHCSEERGIQQEKESQSEPKFTLRDFLAVPFMFLSLLFEYVAVVIGGAWVSFTMLDGIYSKLDAINKNHEK